MWKGEPMPDAAAEVSRAVHSLAECWNRHDMDAIQQAHAFTHETLLRNSRPTLSEVSIRFPAGGIAIARARWVFEGHARGRAFAPQP